MSLEETVSNIVRQVVTELLQQKRKSETDDQRKKLLVLFTDERHALVVKNFIHAVGDSFELVLASCGDQSLPAFQWDKSNNYSEIHLSNRDRAGWEAAMNHADVVVIPALQISTLVKISNLADDEPASGVIVNALMNGKDVVVSSSYILPLGARKLAVPPVMVDVVSSHLQQIIKYGVHVVNKKNLESKVKTLSASAQDSKRPLIHARHVQEWVNEGETHISLPSNTLITALAKEAAKDLGLEWSFDYKEE